MRRVAPRVSASWRPIGGNDPAVPAGVADGLVMRQRVERAFRGGDDLDVEPLEQRARPEFRRLQPFADALVIGFGILAREPFGEAEQGRNGLIKPTPPGRAGTGRA